MSDDNGGNGHSEQPTAIHYDYGINQLGCYARNQATGERFHVDRVADDLILKREALLAELAPIQTWLGAWMRDKADAARSMPVGPRRA